MMIFLWGRQQTHRRIPPRPLAGRMRLWSCQSKSGDFVAYAMARLTKYVDVSFHHGGRTATPQRRRGVYAYAGYLSWPAVAL
ncbi:hypothetical protein CSQ89_17195 [Chitinimonas sp. BJB300]|nr:hypothetical protein CSQ89_17195 [Chitinimonas sp. BJB300]